MRCNIPGRLRVAMTRISTRKGDRDVVVFDLCINDICTPEHDAVPVLFPLMGIEIGMDIIYFHSEKWE